MRSCTHTWKQNVGQMSLLGQTDLVGMMRQAMFPDKASDNASRVYCANHKIREQRLYIADGWQSAMIGILAKPGIIASHLPAVLVPAASSSVTNKSELGWSGETE